MLEKQTYSIFLRIGRMQSKEPQERGKEGMHPCCPCHATHAIQMNHYEISVRMNCFMTACFPVQLLDYGPWSASFHPWLVQNYLQ